MKDWGFVRGAGGVWWFAPGREADLAPLLGDRGGRLASVPGASVLRENRARTLVVLPLPGGGTAFAKVFRRKPGLQGVLDRFAPRALREARVLAEFSRAGFPVPRPVAVSADSIVTEALPDAEPLQRVLERAGRNLRGAAFRERRALLRRVGDLVYRLSYAGYRHGDLHAGNVLLSPPTLAGAPLLVDLQRARRGTGFPPDLVDLAYSLSLAVPASEVLGFVRAAMGGRPHRSLVRDVARWIGWRREAHIRSRTARCRTSGTEFEVSRQGRRVVYRQRTVPIAWVLDAVAEHDARAGRGELVKALPDRRISRFPLPGPGAPLPVVVKEYVHSVWDGVARPLRGTPALRAWTAAHGLRWRGVGTPEALALVEEPGRSLLLMGEVAGAEPLHVAAIRVARGPASAKRAWIAALAAWVRRIHASGVYHPDLKANNVLVDPSAAFHLLDLDRTRFVGDLGEAMRELNLAQLNAAVPSPVSRADRLRFFRAYARGAARFASERDSLARIHRMTLARRHLWPPPEPRP